MAIEGTVHGAGFRLPVRHDGPSLSRWNHWLIRTAVAPRRLRAWGVWARNRSLYENNILS